MNDLCLPFDLPPAGRRHDPLFETVVAVYDLDPAELTRNERGRINRYLAELRTLGVDPAEIPRRRANYQARYPHAADTFAALVSHWAECATPPRRTGTTMQALRRVTDGT